MVYVSFLERAAEREKHFEQFNRMEYNYKSRCEEVRKLKLKEEELKSLNLKFDHKCDEYLVIEREYRKYQDQNRQLLVDNDELKTKAEDARVELKLLQEKVQKINKAHQMSSDASIREKKDLEIRIVKLLKTLESYKSEGTKEQLTEYKRKTNEYKQKVRAANETIAKMGRKLAILGSEQVDDNHNMNYVH